MGMGDWQNRMAMGTVAKVSGNKIMVKDRQGQTRTVVVGANTVITRSAKGTKADLKKSAIANMMGEYDPKKGTFTARMISVGEMSRGPGGSNFVTSTGRISDVKGNQVTLTVPLVLAKDTQITRVDKIPIAKVKAGEQVFAMGEPGANNTVNAQRVSLGNMGGGMGRGGGMGGFGGGMGRRPGGGGGPPGR
jgi:hypothetical protein